MSLFGGCLLIRYALSGGSELRTPTVNCLGNKHKQTNKRQYSGFFVELLRLLGIFNQTQEITNTFIPSRYACLSAFKATLKGKPLH